MTGKNSISFGRNWIVFAAAGNCTSGGDVNSGFVGRNLFVSSQSLVNRGGRSGGQWVTGVEKLHICISTHLIVIVLVAGRGAGSDGGSVVGAV